MSPDEARKVVADLVNAYPAADLPLAKVEAFEQLILDIDFEHACAAARRIATTQRFFPSVAEFREAALELVAGPKRLGAEAWGEVGEQVRRTGYMGEPRFRDPLVAECVRLMGWRSLCLTTNEVADRARFIELYEGLQARERLDVASGLALPPHPASRWELEPAVRPAELPSRREVDAFYALKLVIPEALVSKPPRPKLTDAEIRERWERNRRQAQQLLEQEEKAS